MYGVSKVSNELLGAYYNQKFGLDFRSVRYPGVISSVKYDFNGTTDFPTQMFFECLENGKYDCYLKADQYLPMQYITDSIEATVKLMMADNDKLTHRTYNLAGLSFCPKELGDEVEKLIPGCKIDYKPTWRQAIAEQWPRSIDDKESQKDWGWKNTDDIKSLAKKIWEGIDPKYKQNIKSK